MKDLLTIFDLTKADLEALIKRALELKQAYKRGERYTPLSGKTLVLIFDKASTRTRVSFEAGMNQLGGASVFLSSADSQVGRGEPVKDTARVISGYADGVVVRTFGHEIVEEFAKFSTIPTINGLTDEHHPCQILADVMTIVEKKGLQENFAGLGELKVSWIGDGNNMANSWIEASALCGFELSIACPSGYCPDKGLVSFAKERGANLKICVGVEEAAGNADVLNTDVWASMGQESEDAERRKDFEGFQINKELLELAKPDAMVLHCLPAHRGEEITGDVIDGKNSAVWDQAENRLHIQKAILEKLLT
ncbi:MAG: ornithine carbamoyltransferase [Deltaproteobacteria bacterium]|nr:ornithine carbamoyltransferase [Deltaproteobacteria bacterium]